MGYLEGLMGKNEGIVLTTRQHWITIIGSLIVNGFLILLLWGIGIIVLGAARSLLKELSWVPLAVLAVFSGEGAVLSSS